MILLDENIPENQRLLLKSWRIRLHQISVDIGRQGLQDEEIVPFLQSIGRVTLCTRDLGFYDRRLCHNAYCLACIAVSQYQTASYIRRFLRHHEFNTKSKRSGNVVLIGEAKLRVWRLHAENEELMGWGS